MNIVNNYREGKNRIFKIAILYSVCYFFFFLLSFCRNIIEGTITIGGTDGINNYYPFMLYMADYLKKLPEVWKTEGILFPTLDYYAGMGDDLIRAYNWLGFGDIFYLLAVFVPKSLMPYFFSAFFYVRIYFGGIAFVLFANEVLPDYDKNAIVTAAMLYSLSGFAIESNVHTIFIHAMMYIPLMLWGTERIIAKKRGGKRILIISTAMFGMCGFFYLFVGVVSTGIYAIVRTLKEKEYKSIVLVIISGMLGLGTSMILLFPELIAYVDSPRNQGIKYDLSLFYSIDEYHNMIYTLFMGKDMYRSVFSLAVLGIFALIVALFIPESKNKLWCRGLVAVCIIGYCCPVVSWFFTGMGTTVYDRWEIMLIIIDLYLFIVMWDTMKSCSNKTMLMAMLVLVVFVALGLFDNMFEDRCYRNTLLAYIVYIVWLIVGRLCNAINKTEWWVIKKLCGIYIRYNSELFLMMNVLLVVATWWVNISNYPIRDAEDRPVYVAEQRNLVEELISDDSFYRVEDEYVFKDAIQVNKAMGQGYNGVAEYVSLINPYYANAIANDWAVSCAKDFSVLGLDCRTILSNFSNVKYYLIQSGNESLVPYNYVLKNSTRDKKWNLYENSVQIPFVFNYSCLVDYEEYLSSNAIDKQGLMLQGCAVDGKVDMDTVHNPKYFSTYENIEKVLKQEEKTYAASVYENKEAVEYTVEIPMKAGNENYLYINDDKASSVISYEFDGINKKPMIKDDGENILNIGFSNDNEIKEVKILISKEDAIPLEEIQIAHFDFTDYEGAVSSISKNKCDDLKIAYNNIECTVETIEKSMLCLSVPYMKGWKAYVDGENVDTYRVNSLFLGVELEKGIHDIHFRYITPGIRVGGMITLISIVISLGWFWRYKQGNV